MARSLEDRCDRLPLDLLQLPALPFSDMSRRVLAGRNGRGRDASPDSPRNSVCGGDLPATHLLNLDQLGRALCERISNLVAQDLLVRQLALNELLDRYVGLRPFDGDCAVMRPQRRCKVSPKVPVAALGLEVPLLGKPRGPPSPNMATPSRTVWRLSFFTPLVLRAAPKAPASANKTHQKILPTLVLFLLTLVL